jgi:diacylglycerol kinase (ATP)
MNPHSIWQGSVVGHLSKTHPMTPGGSVNSAIPRMKNGSGDSLKAPTDSSGSDPVASAMKGHGGIFHGIAALGYSVKGLRAAWRTETAFRQELVVGVLMLLAAPWLAPHRTALVLMIATVLLVWLVELINTAIEAVCDSISTEHHRLLGVAKDVGSAAVLISLSICGLTWLLLLIP